MATFKGAGHPSEAPKTVTSQGLFLLSSMTESLRTFSMETHTSMATATTASDDAGQRLRTTMAVATPEAPGAG